jgi:hypothetical protein
LALRGAAATMYGAGTDTVLICLHRDPNNWLILS